MIQTVIAWLPVVAVAIMVVLMRRDLQRTKEIENRVDEQLHAIHEAMLLWEFGAKHEAIQLLAEHDLFVG